jgi:hypothetical protein
MPSNSGFVFLHAASRRISAMNMNDFQYNPTALAPLLYHPEEMPL